MNVQYVLKESCLSTKSSLNKNFLFVEDIVEQI